jgi:hypothetical protein
MNLTLFFGLPMQIPTLGMLSYFVNIYNSQNLLTPTSILVLFIVTVLATVWAIFTLFTYHRSRYNSHFVAFIDLCFVGAFIAGVWYLRGIAGDTCSNIYEETYTLSLGIFGTADVNAFGINVDKACAMLKACWVFGIMNCIFFFITSLLAAMVGGRHDRREKDVVVTRSTRRSGSHRSHRSHRSSHSGRRHAYV